MKVSVWLSLILLPALLNSQGLHLEWGGAMHPYRITDMVVDDSSNVYITGNIRSTGDVDPGLGVTNLQYQNAGGVRNVFFAKIDPFGQLLWAFGIPTTDSASMAKSRIHITDSGDIVAVGDFAGIGLDFDPGPDSIILSSGIYGSIFILKIRPSGKVSWAKKIGTPSLLIPAWYWWTSLLLVDFDLDPWGNMYISGIASDTIDVDPGPLQNFLIPNSPATLGYGPGLRFIVKLDPNGNFIWKKSMDLAQPFGIEISDSGNVVMFGVPYNSFDIDPGPGQIIVNNQFVAYIHLMDSSWNSIWVRKFDDQMGTNFIEIQDAAFDSEENIYLSGNRRGTSDLDPGPGVSLFSGPRISPFAMRFNPQGDQTWLLPLENSNQYYINQHADGPTSIHVNDNGLVLFTGYVFDSVDFDPGPAINYQGTNGYGRSTSFSMLLDTAGDFFSMDAFEFPYWHYCGNARPGIASHFGKNNEIFLAHHFGYTIDIDPDTSEFLLTASSNCYSQDAGSFIKKISFDSCYLIEANLVSFNNITCSQPGIISVEPENGIRPFSYQWSTNPIQTDSLAIFTNPGNYHLTLLDSSGCVIGKGFHISGPSDSSGYDLNTNLSSSGFSPGTQSRIQLDAYNSGCLTISGDLTLVLDSATTFDSADVAPTSILGDTITWSFAGLQYDSSHLNPKVFVSVSSSAIPGDQVCLETYITPFLLDVDSTNNRKLYCIPIIGSYDPNDKQVYPQGECSSNYVLADSTLTYTLRFQNTGNAPAINIRLLDQIDPSLDLNSFSLVGTSHEDLLIEILQGRILQFTYDSIMLPDSVNNEPLSHGYVMFEIMPKPGLPDGTRIENTAEIYFDFNSPIQTNTIFSTMVNSIPYVDASVSVNNKTLVANMPGVQYQWFTCDSGSVDPGDTLRTFTPTLAGTYACIITYQGCSKTSDCIHINPLGIEQGATDKIRIFPNPSSGSFSINLDHGSSTGNSLLIIRDIGGKQVYTKKIGNERVSTLDLDLSSGMYILTIRRKDNEQRIKLIIE